MSLDRTPPAATPSRLARRLGLGDAVVLGLGSMLGAGVFAAIGPAAAAAGSGLLIGLALAGAVAYCNATSSAQLAAVYPSSGGTYVYGREQLGRFWGWLAGWGFVTGKTASCAAMALTFGAYAWPENARVLAVAAVAALAAANYRGVRKTALLTRCIVAVVLATLAAAVAGALLGGAADLGGLRVRPDDLEPVGVLRAAGLLFFAFAGYARIATLGEEVRDPQRTIPLAIPLALGVALVVYAAVAASALAAVGPEGLAGATAPLVAAVSAGDLSGLAPLVRFGAAVAALGVLLALLAGVGRTTFAMAANAELPAALAAVHPRFSVPHRAEVAVAAVVIVVVLLGELTAAIAFSAFCVLVYYLIANLSAATLPAEQRRWPRALAWAGVGGCALLAFSLPPVTIGSGLAVLALGAALYATTYRRVTSEEQR